jgi:hypothetical protein
MSTIEKYLNRVPAQHRDKPKFKATLTNVLNPCCSLIDIMASTAKEYDLDRAIGNQLTVVGEWIGRNRKITVPIEKPWFSFDDTAEKGWDAGIWFGAYSSEYGIVDADDDSYRLLLRLQILLNNWDGTAETLIKGFQAACPDAPISVNDHCDMTAEIVVDASALNTTQKSAVKEMLERFHPVGVAVTVTINE